MLLMLYSALCAAPGRPMRQIASNIAVMQCDDAVRDLTFLHSTDELDRFAACLTLTGGGGTDFRPAFAKIEELRRDGTLRDLQGVLYFTDGKGTYPTRRPPYETAFLFLENRIQNLSKVFCLTA